MGNTTTNNNFKTADKKCVCVFRDSVIGRSVLDINCCLCEPHVHSLWRLFLWRHQRPPPPSPHQAISWHELENTLPRGYGGHQRTPWPIRGVSKITVWKTWYTYQVRHTDVESTTLWSNRGSYSTRTQHNYICSPCARKSSIFPQRQSPRTS